jgi:hypothetical protein
MTSLVKKAKIHAESALSILLSKYSADALTVDCEKMSEVDYKMYLELDKCIEKMSEILKDEMPLPDPTSEAVMGESGE